MTQKRKASKNLFRNLNTIKNRKRIDKLNDFEKKLNDAKKIDQMNENYYLKKLRATQNYINASSQNKKKLKNAMKETRRAIK
jgi:ribosomal 30S subunit maturation factor RimM